jgi:hemoglobin-like flavoprotein
MSVLAVSSASSQAAAASPAFSLTQSQKTLIRRSYRRLEPAAELVGTLFFMRLFESEPEMRGYFEGPIKPHAKRMAETLRLAVGALNRPHILKPTLKLLGASFRQKGMRPEDFGNLSAALIWSFDKSLEAEFTYSTKRAWIAYLDQAMNVMATA